VFSVNITKREIISQSLWNYRLREKQKRKCNYRGNYKVQVWIKLEGGKRKSCTREDWTFDKVIGVFIPFRSGKQDDLGDCDRKCQSKLPINNVRNFTLRQQLFIEEKNHVYKCF